MKRLILLAVLAFTAVTDAQRPATHATLTEGQTLHGFRVEAIYLNDADAAIGSRYVHVRSGFTLDLLEIESVPQAFVWVTTYPTSDKGEPHTQEHLLLGKGNRGRRIASQEPMSLASSSAFTMQWRTCYDFYTTAGGDVFHDEFERRLDALLHPDYSDEEIRREVRNFGVTDTPGAKTLGLEEKGTVYNEMVSSSDQPGRRLFSDAIKMVYGENHPLTFNSGGSPEALRIIQPSDIRRFHADHYHLANMGAIVSVPKEMAVDGVLAKLDASLTRVEPSRPNRPVKTERDLPAARPAPAGQIRYAEYPHRNDQQPGGVRLTWPADRHLDLIDQTLLEFFLDTFAGDPTTNLYKKLIDSRTRETDIGAQSVGAGVSTDQGFPVTVIFGDVPAAKMNDRDLADLRARVVSELDRIAAWPANSPELDAFNARLKTRIVAARREMSKFVSSPPNFGFRGNGAGWMTQLDQLDKAGGFRRSVTMKPVLSSIEQVLATSGNPWGRYLPRWELTDVQPWVTAAKPNPALIKTAQDERIARVATELTRLKAEYGTTDDQQTLRRFQTDYDAKSAEIDREAGRVAPPKFIANPPMTLDDPLIYRAAAVNGVPAVASTFDSMPGTTTGIALRIDGVTLEERRFLALLPQLLTRVGVVENGKPVSYELMSERLRNEILGLSADYSVNFRTGRAELVVRGSGNDLAESKRAIDWMRLVLLSPDWRPENLPRIRDVVDQALSGLRRTMQGAEENWVQGVANTYRRQDTPWLLTTSSFMTQAHDVVRLRWMLKDGAATDRAAAAAALRSLSEVRGTREQLKTRLVEWQKGSDRLLSDAARDLDLSLNEIPDSSLAVDWSHLCQEMAGDLTAGPERALTALNGIRTRLLSRSGARLFQIGSSRSQQDLAASLQTLVSGLSSAPFARTTVATTKRVDERLRGREAGAAKPVFVGLLNPNSQSGVFLNSAPLTHWSDTSRDKLLDYLASQLYGGGGGHSVFMKTIGAGLSYSNGIGGRLADGRIGYYAERTPELPQTLLFVIGEIKRAQPDESLVDYAISLAFGGIRSASSYESRGEAMAANLADGLTPDVVRAFHQGILALRSSPTLSRDINQRMTGVYAKVLPGLGTKASEVDDGVYFVIGPEKQFAAWEAYLKTVEGPAATVYRLSPRDFWID